MFFILSFFQQYVFFLFSCICSNKIIVLLSLYKCSSSIEMMNIYCHFTKLYLLNFCNWLIIAYQSILLINESYIYYLKHLFQKQMLKKTFLYLKKENYKNIIKPMIKQHTNIILHYFIWLFYSSSRNKKMCNCIDK